LQGQIKGFFVVLDNKRQCRLQGQIKGFFVGWFGFGFRLVASAVMINSCCTKAKRRTKAKAIAILVNEERCLQNNLLERRPIGRHTWN
jgi:hypothetical protein